MRAVVLSLLIVPALSCAVAIAQQHTVPGTGASSGYDPFQLDWSSGRFRYVPVPYDPADAGSPFKYNWFTGRWDYVPWPAPPSVYEMNQADKSITPGNLADEAEVASGRILGTPAPLPAAAPPSSMMRLGPIEGIQNYIRPTTRPFTHPRTLATQPASSVPARSGRLPGRWEYDQASNRWVHVMPSGR
jgi:hypothetical protein